MTEREAFEQQYGYRPYDVDMLWDAWERACKWEREACAKVCENHKGTMTPTGRRLEPDGSDCAHAIRMRSNAEITGRTLAQNEADGA